MTGNPTIYFDCDDTLVMWGMGDHPDAMTFVHYGREHKLVPHKEHIELIKKHKAEGYEIVIWSYGGREWCEEIVNKLGLINYVDGMHSKPDYYYDDCPTSQILHEHRRLYMQFPKSEKKETGERKTQF